MILVTCATHGTRSPRAAPFLRLAQRGRVKSRDCVISSSQATEFAISCLASGDQPSSGALVAIICFVASLWDCQPKVPAIPTQIATR
jgi:hypothetical protein